MAAVIVAQTANVHATWVTVVLLVSFSVPMNAPITVTVSKELACALPGSWELIVPLQDAVMGMELVMTQELVCAMLAGMVMTAR